MNGNFQTGHVGWSPDYQTPPQGPMIGRLIPPDEATPSTSLNRFEVAKMHRQYALLRDHPQARAERIARHYLAHAQLAMDMLKAVEMRGHVSRPADLEELINHHMKIIVENHRNEFGIELSWDNPNPK